MVSHALRELSIWMLVINQYPSVSLQALLINHEWLLSGSRD